MQSSQAHASAGKRRVVDALTRTLHGVMALSFALAYISSEVDSFRFVHVTMGYTLGFVVLLRLAWGLAGPRRVHLGPLFRRFPSSSELLENVQELEWKVLLKHLLNLSLTIVLISALPVLVSGYMAYFSLLGKWTEEIHETAANSFAKLPAVVAESEILPTSSKPLPPVDVAADKLPSLSIATHPTVPKPFDFNFSSYSFLRCGSSTL